MFTPLQKAWCQSREGMQKHLLGHRSPECELFLIHKHREHTASALREELMASFPSHKWPTQVSHKLESWSKLISKIKLLLTSRDGVQTQSNLISKLVLLPIQWLFSNWNMHRSLERLAKTRLPGFHPQVSNLVDLLLGKNLCSWQIIKCCCCWFGGHTLRTTALHCALLHPEQALQALLLFHGTYQNKEQVIRHSVRQSYELYIIVPGLGSSESHGNSLRIYSKLNEIKEP